MKYLPLLIIVLFACKSEDETSHKTLFYTFEDAVTEAIAKTEIEPETKKIIALHMSDPVDLATDLSNNNLYVAFGGGAEIFVYKNRDLTSGQELYSAENIIAAMAIDPAHNKLYWIVQNWGVVYQANLDGSSSMPSTLFGRTFLTPQSKGLAIDPIRNKLYILDTENKRILAADLNTGAAPVELMTSSSFEMTDPHDLEISEDGNTLYWADLNKINTTDTNTGTSLTLIESAATSLFLHYPTNSLYVAFSNSIFKTPLGSTPTFERVFQDDGSQIMKFVIQ
jgi:DNA-binding beta-propeller fold protein YncE